MSETFYLLLNMHLFCEIMHMVIPLRELFLHISSFFTFPSIIGIVALSNLIQVANIFLQLHGSLFGVKKIISVKSTMAAIAHTTVYEWKASS